MFRPKNYIYTKRFVTVIFVLLSVWWLLLQTTLLPSPFSSKEAFSVTYGLVALFGGITGIFISKQFDGLHSTIGKVTFFLSLGILAQEFGQLSYNFQLFYLHTEVPYPSIGDIGYFGSIFLYIHAIWLLMRTFSDSIKSKGMKMLAMLVMVIILGVSYYIFLRDYAFSEVPLLTALLDFGYPLGQSIYVALALITYLFARNQLGGILKNKVLLLLLALAIQYLADFMFLYQNHQGTWEVAGINEYTYLVAYFFMTLALINLSNVFSKLKAGVSS